MQVICDQTRHRLNKYDKKNIHYIDNDPEEVSLNVRPSRLTFTFNFENFEIQEKIIEITNYSSKPCPIQLLPLETQYFRIGNVPQRKCLTPGSVFKINILFMPDENRDYNDVLTIRYINNQLIQIKIFAKIVTIFSFPTTVNFGNVPLGQPVYYEIPIHCYAKKEFSFAILLSTEDLCVDIYPRWGHVKPGQEPLTVMVIYRPLRYISMHFQIRIFITDLCKTPHVINFYAYTRPGLLRESIKDIQPKMKSKRQRKRIGTVHGREIKPMSKKKTSLEPLIKTPIAQGTKFGEILLRKCSHFPLYSLHATNCILNSKIRRSFNEYELNGPLGIYLFELMEQKVRKQKEFLTKIEIRRDENDRTKFHYKPKVNHGTSDMNANQIVEIKIHRQQLWDKYLMIFSPSTQLFERQKAMKLKQRILRASHKYPDATYVFSQKDVTFLHYCKITPFIQAVRKIILRNRLLKILEKLHDEIYKLFDEPIGFV